MIVNQHLIVFGELRHLSDTPRRQADTGTGNQHQRIALTIKLIVEVDAVDIHLACLDRLDFIHAGTPSNYRPYTEYPCKTSTETLSNKEFRVNKAPHGDSERCSGTI